MAVELYSEPVVELYSEPVVELYSEPVVELYSEPVVELYSEPVGYFFLTFLLSVVVSISVCLYRSYLKGKILYSKQVIYIVVVR